MSLSSGFLTRKYWILLNVPDHTAGVVFAIWEKDTGCISRDMRALKIVRNLSTSAECELVFFLS